MGKENNSRQKVVSRMIFNDSVHKVGVFVVLITMVVILALINSSYVIVGDFVDIVKQATINGILAVGITFTTISEGIDLSLGSIFVIIVIVVGWLTVLGVPPVVAIRTGAVLGTPMGSINGLLVTEMRLQPFIATPGTMSVFWSITYVAIGRWPIFNMPDAYGKSLGAKMIGDVSISIFVPPVIVVITHILLKETRFGDHLPAVGDNEEAAKLSGVSVDRIKTLAYSTCGSCIVFTGMIMPAGPGTGEPATGQGYGLDAIVALAIDGTRVAGGKDSILGTFLGVLLLAALEIDLIITGASTFWQYIVISIIIVIAVYFKVIQSKLSSEFLRSQA